MARATEWATADGMAVNEGVTEVGSGLNGRRRRSGRLRTDLRLAALVVEHRDRLARFGVEQLGAARSAQGRRIVVVDPGEANGDLVRDMIAGLTSGNGMVVMAPLRCR